MNNRIHFLRHAHPVIDRDAPQSKWLLSEVGIEQAKDARAQIGAQFDFVFSSAEQKAIQTAEIFVFDSPHEVQKDSAFNELNRDHGPFLPKKNYDLGVKKAMTTPSLSVHGWETANSAINRFAKGVRRINKEHSGRQILLVSHGIVLSLYFADLLSCRDMVYNRWLKIRPCSWGIVENGFVTLDITG